ncbi:hypothetical protein L1279_002540 [Planomicrobium sp. HSC-17F08]|nr:hypothetical protein [Planomicrobium sp. HSC-17F08]
MGSPVSFGSEFFICFIHYHYLWTENSKYIYYYFFYC